MIKQRRYRSSATPPSATHPPVTSSATPATAAPAPSPAAPPPDVPPTAAPRTGKPRKAEATSKGSELGDQIGHKLKAMFKDVVAEPVPEKFHQLLEELERTSGKP